MDSVDICAATSTTDNKVRVNKKNRAWRKRLHRRKTAFPPPTMQSEVQHGPKKRPDDWEQSTVWPSSKKPPQEAQPSQQRTSDNGNTLRFTCSQCMDNLEYAPKDLMRHFEENHRGSQPVFPCHMCTFNTHEFSYLQVHLLSHKDTFSTCSICNDNVKRTWSEFSGHLAMQHGKNGKYSCEMCQKFSTGDVRVFLEHLCIHHFGLEGANEIDLSLDTNDYNQCGSITTTQILRCQHCGYEASQKGLLVKHINANHVSQVGNQKKKDALPMKPNDPVPKMKPRLTRSAVREMCWLTQDCLSLPGREFLDKYCHLSDPQTTLDETQQFLMKSVAGETGDQKWTKALKSVLSNVPQDMNIHPNSENCMSNPADLTVLTVKNRIIVAQSGATYAKRLKMMASADKETLPPESAPGDAHCGGDGCPSNLDDHTQCPQNETKHNDASMPTQNEQPECIQMQENRENQELKTDHEEHAEPKKAHPPEDDISSEPMVTNETQEQTSSYKALPKNKRRRRTRKRRCKKQNKGPSALALKLVLKKNTTKGKQWMSKSSLSPSGGGPIDDHHGPPNLHKTIEDTVQVFSNALSTEGPRKTLTKASDPDQHAPSETMTGTAQSKPGEELQHCAAEPTGSEIDVGNKPVVLGDSMSTNREKRDDLEKSLQFLETEADEGSQSNVMAAPVTAAATCPENLQLSSSDSVPDCPVSAALGVTPLSQPAITPQGKTAKFFLHIKMFLKLHFIFVLND